MLPVLAACVEQVAHMVGSVNEISGLHFVDCDFHSTSPDPWLMSKVDEASCSSVNSKPVFPVS
jgi:hypothetical protein